MKILSSIFLFFFCINAHSLEIIRDPFFENYFKNIQIKYQLPKAKVQIVKHNKVNAFVLGNNIYITTGLIKNIDKESVLKSIYFHEIGHIYHSHYSSKKLGVNSNKKKKAYNDLFSIGATILTGNPNIGIASNLTLNKSILNTLSTNSIKFEIQADNFMLDTIRKNKINTDDLIEFFINLPENNNIYFKSHPPNKDRVISLKKFKNFKKKNNTKEFEWLRAKYSKKSNISEYNDFFKSLDKGIVKTSNIDLINDNDLTNYEIYKSGIIIKNVDKMYLNLISDNSNPYLKIEFFNRIIDTSNSKYYKIIAENKHNKEIQSEYFFHFLYGKYYNKIDNENLSSFYFCQFYKMTNFKNKKDFYCNKFDIKNIPEIDKSYAILK